MKKTMILPLLAMILAACFILPMPARAVVGDYAGDVPSYEFNNGVLRVYGQGPIPYMNRFPWEDIRSQIRELVVEEGITAVSMFSMAGFTNLQKVTLPNSLQLIDMDSFADCTSLTQIAIPAGVIWISPPAFRGCSNLARIDVDPGNATYCSDSRGIVYSKDQSTLVRLPHSYAGALVLPASVTAISEWAMSYCPRLTEVTIQGNVTELPGYLFTGCGALRRVNLPDSIQSIGKHTFSECYSLKYITLPAGLNQVNSAGFTSCSFWHVFFKGSQAQWNALNMPNKDYIKNAPVHFDVSGDPVKLLNTTDCTSKSICQCNICDDILYDESYSGTHTWDAGVVVKPANCKEGGSIEYTCTVCKAKDTKAVEKTDTHRYSPWEKVNDDTHKHICADCKNEETVAHTWDSGTVLKVVNCIQDGEVKYTCTGCAATKNEIQTKLSTHTYDHGCDPDCNVCGQTRTTTHVYKTTWSKNKTSHYYECSECKEQKDTAEHTPGPAPTEEAPQTCTVCGYIIKPALGHTHSFAQEWTADDTGHWYACAGCEEQGSFDAHDMENDCDPDCAVCGYTRKTAHNYEKSWTADGENHWRVCKGCGDMVEQNPHEPGPEATASAAQTCSVCGYVIAPALEDGKDSTITIGATDEPKRFPWWTIAVVGVLAAGAAAAFVIIKKKS